MQMNETQDNDSTVLFPVDSISLRTRRATLIFKNVRVVSYVASVGTPSAARTVPE